MLSVEFDPIPHPRSNKVLTDMSVGDNDVRHASMSMLPNKA